MSRKKMIEFDAAYYKQLITKKIKEKQEKRMSRLSKLLDSNEDTVKAWFRNGRMPEEKIAILNKYLDGELRMRKKKVDSKPVGGNISFDEITVDEPLPVSLNKGNISDAVKAADAVDNSFKEIFEEAVESALNENKEVCDEYMAELFETVAPEVLCFRNAAFDYPYDLQLEEKTAYIEGLTHLLSLSIIERMKSEASKR